RRRPARLPRGNVSILVVMERTHRRARPRRPAHRDRVSILVVMERTHRPLPGQQASHSAPCFNPCCDGTDSSTPAPPPKAAATCCFNPCCDGTDSSTSSSPEPPDWEPKFQSLL